MARVRVLVAALLALALVPAVAGTAGAGGNATSLDIGYTCNAETGEYDLVFTVLNDFGGEAPISVEVYEVDGADRAVPAFSPTPVAGDGGLSTATDSIPGTSPDVYMEISFWQGEVYYDDGLDLPGDCLPPATTTTTSTTVAPTTTAAAQPAQLQPAFTG